MVLKKYQNPKGGLNEEGRKFYKRTEGLDLKAPLKTKVYLQRLNKVVGEEVKLYEEAKQELFKKLGVEEDGSISIPSENFEAFNKELQDLLTAEKEINVSELWGADLKLEHLESIETEEYYPALFTLIDSK